MWIFRVQNNTRKRVAPAPTHPPPPSSDPFQNFSPWNHSSLIINSLKSLKLARLPVGVSRHFLFSDKQLTVEIDAVSSCFDGSRSLKMKAVASLRKIPRQAIDKCGLQWLNDASLLKSRDFKPEVKYVTKNAQSFLQQSC